MSDLQAIVDGLASQLGRPALVEDPGHRVVAYSEQTAPVDEVRLGSILRRRVPPEVVTIVRAAGVPRSRRPVRLPAYPELHMLARLCVPLWHGDLLLGFVWFIDADRSISDAQLDTVRGATWELALALYRENQDREAAARGQARAVRLLLSGVPRQRAEGLAALLDDGVLAGGGGGAAAQAVTALVALPAAGCGGDAGGEPGNASWLALERGLLLARRRLGVGEAAQLVRHDHGVLLVRAGADAVHEAATRLAGGASAAIGAVGVGGPRRDPADAHRSYEEAVLAARVATRLPELGPLAYWSDLGIYQALARIGDDDLDTASVHPGLEALLGDPANQALLETLETYLDLAGNAQSAAERLNLHRTSLYYRLQRVEQLAGSDLKSGTERLALHLAFKLARLAGRYRPAAATAIPGQPPPKRAAAAPPLTDPDLPTPRGPAPAVPVR